jgi:hypothetical protein
MEDVGTFGTHLRVKQPQSACSFCKARKIKVSTPLKRLDSSIPIRCAVLEYLDVNLSVSDFSYSVMGRDQHARHVSSIVEQQAALLKHNTMARIEIM